MTGARAASLAEVDAEQRGEDDVVDSIEQSFLRLSAVVRANLREAANGLGPDVQPAAWTVLRAVMRLAPTQAGAIAAATGMDKSAVSRQLKELRERGLVAIEQSPEDARAVVVTPTEDARMRVRVITDVWRGRFRDIFGSWTDEELQTFSVLLDRFAASMPPAGSRD